MKFLIALLSSTVILAGTYSAQAGGIESFPQCGDAKVLHEIVEHFNRAEIRNKNTGLELENISGARERQTLAGGERQINRRYCRAHAELSNGRHPTVHYLIEQRVGFASIGWNVEFCIPGQDRWMVYGGSCRVLRR